ncbi:MAG: hypothetical protein WDW38_006252 [Sanguina aurantia]
MEAQHGAVAVRFHSLRSLHASWTLWRAHTRQAAAAHAQQARGLARRQQMSAFLERVTHQQQARSAQQQQQQHEPPRPSPGHTPEAHGQCLPDQRSHPGVSHQHPSASHSTGPEPDAHDALQPAVGSAAGAAARQRATSAHTGGRAHGSSSTCSSSSSSSVPLQLGTTVRALLGNPTEAAAARLAVLRLQALRGLGRPGHATLPAARLSPPSPPPEPSTTVAPEGAPVTPGSGGPGTAGFPRTGGDDGGAVSGRLRTKVGTVAQAPPLHTASRATKRQHAVPVAAAGRGHGPTASSAHGQAHASQGQALHPGGDRVAANGKDDSERAPHPAATLESAREPWVTHTKDRPAGSSTSGAKTPPVGGTHGASRPVRRVTESGAVVVSHGGGGAGTAVAATAVAATAVAARAQAAAQLQDAFCAERRRRRRTEGAAAEAETDLQQHQAALALLHCHRSLVGRVGLKPWLTLWRNGSAASTLASAHACTALTKLAWVGWRLQCTERNWTVVSVQAAGLARAGNAHKVGMPVAFSSPEPALRAMQTGLDSLRRWAWVTRMGRQGQARWMLRKWIRHCLVEARAAQLQACAFAARTRRSACLRAWKSAATAMASSRLLAQLQRDHGIRQQLGMLTAKRALRAWHEVLVQGREQRGRDSRNTQTWGKINGWLGDLHGRRCDTPNNAQGVTCSIGSSGGGGGATGTEPAITAPRPSGAQEQSSHSGGSVGAPPDAGSRRQGLSAVHAGRPSDATTSVVQREEEGVARQDSGGQPVPTPGMFDLHFGGGSILGLPPELDYSVLSDVPADESVAQGRSKLQRSSTTGDAVAAGKHGQSRLRTLQNGTETSERVLIDHVVEVPADHSQPDSVFVEDTVIIIGSTAVTTFPGAVERQGEVAPVRATLESLGHPDLRELVGEARLDGGDVLFTGSEVWVGESATTRLAPGFYTPATGRSNEAAVQQLRRIFEGRYAVLGLSVPGAGQSTLHLKSIMTALDSHTILVADGPAGREVVALPRRDARTPPLAFVYLPDAIAANVLRIGPNVVMQAGFPESEALVSRLCKERGLVLHTLCMAELIKADGALTCCSVLFKLQTAQAG